MPSNGRSASICSARADTQHTNERHQRETPTRDTNERHQREGEAGNGWDHHAGFGPTGAGARPGQPDHVRGGQGRRRGPVRGDHRHRRRERFDSGLRRDRRHRPGRGSGQHRHAALGRARPRPHRADLRRHPAPAGRDRRRPRRVHRARHRGAPDRSGTHLGIQRDRRQRRAGDRRTAARLGSGDGDRQALDHGASRHVRHAQRPALRLVHGQGRDRHADRRAGHHPRAAPRAPLAGPHRTALPAQGQPRHAAGHRTAGGRHLLPAGQGRHRLRARAVRLRQDGRPAPALQVGGRRHHRLRGLRRARQRDDRRPA